MKPRFSKVTAIFLSIVVFLTSFAANPLRKSVTFLEARYVPGVGIVLLFEASGLKNADLRGATIHVHSNEYKLSCSFKDGNEKDETTIVRCVASGGLSQWAGESFTAYLAGSVFNGIIPAEKSNVFTCSEGEVLVLWLRVFDDEWEGVTVIPAEFLSDFVIFLQELGLDYEVIDQACFTIEEENPS